VFTSRPILLLTYNRTQVGKCS